MDDSFSESVLSKLNLTSVQQVSKKDAEQDKLSEVYSKVGLLLSRYKSGKIPKAFKIIPTLKNWEKVLLLTKPESWTTNAVFEGTRIFVSNLSPQMAQRYLEFVLLPRLRQDILESKKMDPHLYQALRKSIYKPASFFKGIIIPLCQSDDFTLKEASIISSIVGKSTIPVLHSAAALCKVIQLPYSGARAIMIRTLLDKKYAFPCTVIKAVVKYFEQFIELREELPVLWHQSLLVFCQRYKNELDQEQQMIITNLSNLKYHEDISPEIQRELSSITAMQS